MGRRDGGAEGRGETINREGKKITFIELCRLKLCRALSLTFLEPTV